MSGPGHVEHLNHSELVRTPAFSHVVTVTGPTKTVYVGGQNAVTGSGEIVGHGDIGRQTEQVFQNLQFALGAAGATLEHVIKWTIYVLEGQPLQPAFEVFQRVWGRRPNPPLITLVMVSAQANPDILLELEAIAVVPE